MLIWDFGISCVPLMVSIHERNEQLPFRRYLHPLKLYFLSLPCPSSSRNTFATSVTTLFEVRLLHSTMNFFIIPFSPEYQNFTVAPFEFRFRLILEHHPFSPEDCYLGCLREFSVLKTYQTRTRMCHLLDTGEQHSHDRAGFD